MRQKAMGKYQEEGFSGGGRKFKDEATACQFSRDTQETRSILVQGRAVGEAETVMEGRDMTGFGLLHKGKGESLEGSELTDNNQT